SADFWLSPKLRAMDLLLHPQQMLPLTGLPRFGHKGYSVIVASPKQELFVCPNNQKKYPHIIHSTGTISSPDGYRPTRAGRLAKQDHVFGGLIVEIENEKLFHIRQIQTES